MSNLTTMTSTSESENNESVNQYSVSCRNTSRRVSSCIQKTDAQNVLGTGYNTEDWCLGVSDSERRKQREIAFSSLEKKKEKRLHHRSVSFINKVFRYTPRYSRKKKMEAFGPIELKCAPVTKRNKKGHTLLRPEKLVYEREKKEALQNKRKQQSSTDDRSALLRSLNQTLEKESFSDIAAEAIENQTMRMDYSDLVTGEETEERKEKEVSKNKRRQSKRPEDCFSVTEMLMRTYMEEHQLNSDDSVSQQDIDDIMGVDVQQYANGFIGVEKDVNSQTKTGVNNSLITSDNVKRSVVNSNEISSKTRNVEKEKDYKRMNGDKRPVAVQNPEVVTEHDEEVPPVPLNHEGEQNNKTFIPEVGEPYFGTTQTNDDPLKPTKLFRSDQTNKQGISKQREDDVAMGDTNNDISKDNTLLIVKTHSVFLDNHSAFLDTQNAFVANHKAFLEMHKEPLGNRTAFIETQKAFINTHKRFLEEQKAFIATHEAFLEALQEVEEDMQTSFQNDIRNEMLRRRDERDMQNEELANVKRHVTSMI